MIAILLRMMAPSKDDITRSNASTSTIELNLNVAGKMLLREKADPLRGRACLQQVQQWATGVLVLPFGIIIMAKRWEEHATGYRIINRSGKISE